jgi:hypothetical protein
VQKPFGKLSSAIGSLDMFHELPEPLENMKIYREQYATDGVIVARRIFSSSICRSLELGWETLREKIQHGAIARNARFVQGPLPEPLACMCRHESLVTSVQTLLGTNNIALYMNRILLKDAKWSGAVAIHQDMPYFSGGLDKVSVFVPLTPTAARNGNGGLIFVKGSHKFGNLQRGTIRRDNFPPLEELGPDLDVGDVVFVNFLTWHYSDDAVNPADRPLIQIAYQPSSDGSYGGATLGVPEPLLISGQWETTSFAAWGESTIPDA